VHIITEYLFSLRQIHIHKESCTPDTSRPTLVLRSTRSKTRTALYLHASWRTMAYSIPSVPGLHVSFGADHHFSSLWRIGHLPIRSSLRQVVTAPYKDLRKTRTPSLLSVTPSPTMKKTDTHNGVNTSKPDNRALRTVQIGWRGRHKGCAFVTPRQN
jgi:hypothetical protein